MTWGCKQFMSEEAINVPKKPARTSAEMNLPNPFPEFTTTQVSFVCPGRSGRRLGEDPPTSSAPSSTVVVTQTQTSAPTSSATVVLNRY